MQETKKYISIKKATVENNLNGLTVFLNVPGLDKRLKSHINTSNYHYFSNNGNDQLWIIGLEPGTFGFAKAKLVASLKDGQFSMIKVSYNYDTIAYQNRDFSTYTGTTSVYSQKQKKLWDLVYEKGKLTASKHTDCNSCLLIVPSDPPQGYTDWCTIYPPLCNYYGGGTDGTNDPTMMTMDPGYDAGGGGGSGTGYPTVVNQLTAMLNLNSSQAYWLAQDEYLNRAYEIYSYLQNSTEINKNQISIDHINGMINNADYLNFVVNHAATGDPYTIWWEDNNWLDDPNNFNLDIDYIGNGYGSLTTEEKALVKQHPVAAAIIYFNRQTAENYTVSKMGHNGLNDKSDAFRHTYFQALNTMSIGIGPSLTQQFSDAHESETPLQLILEKQMDLFNNSVGIYYGQTLSFWTSLDELANGVLQKINNGECMYLKPIDLNDPNFWGANGNSQTATHGITSSTSLTPTNQ